MSEFRNESDSMGQVKVPRAALFGAQTQRAVENFRISPWRFGRRFIRALGLVKLAAAEANEVLGLLPVALAEPIKRAAEEVSSGRHDDQFVVDVFQSGSGTSTNMNANEVIATLANQMLGAEGEGRGPVHPNDHVNMGQSSNDVIPSAGHVAALLSLTELLLPALDGLKSSLARKAGEFEQVVKSGRTHLMDAAPVTLGQEFGGYASQVEHGLARIAGVFPHLSELALGGTAVGTGLNAAPGFARAAIEQISARVGLPLKEASNHFEAQGARDAMVEASGALKTVAVSVAKIANDLRWLASGPASGIGELKMPPLQPGSSIMPGKVNPVVPETVIQVCAQVIGNDAAITLGGLGGAFELNTMMPLMIYDLLFSIETFASACEHLAVLCVDGLEADEDRCADLLSRNSMLAAALVPALGYDRVAEIVSTAQRTGETLQQTVLDTGLMTQREIDDALDAGRMTEPGFSG